MGGRSAALVCLSVMLWQMHDREDDISLGDLDVEGLSAMAFQSAGEPSYIQPEWGIGLVGVLIARHSRRLSSAAKAEVFKQSRLLLEYLSENSPNPSVRSSSRTLLEVWKANFRKGLDSVIQSGYREWPSSARFAKMPARDLDKKLKKVLYVLPAAYDKNDFALYRLFLERKGTWKLLQAVSLR
jgi:hypothetical protein